MQPKKILIQNYNDKTGFDKETEDINVHNWLKNKLPDDDAYFERYGNSDIIKDDFLIYDSSSNLDKLSRRLENIHTSKFIKPKDNSKNLYTYGKCTVMTSPKDKQYLTRFQSIHYSGESSKRNQTTRNNNVHSKRNIGLNNDTQFSSIKSINTNNEIFYSQEIPSAGSKIEDNHKNEIKSWLSSIGIKFAKDIDFDKPQVEEFRDG